MTPRTLATAVVVSFLITIVLGVALSFRDQIRDSSDACRNPYPAQPGKPCAQGTELLLVGPVSLVCGCHETVDVPELQIVPEVM